MPDFQDFIDQLRAVGVHVDGEDQLDAEQAAAGSRGWVAVVTELALNGRKRGVRFVRAQAVQPTDEQLQRIVRGYPFSDQQARTFIRNVVGPVGSSAAG